MEEIQPKLELPATQKQSRLFRLPAELRLKIWGFAVGGQKIHLATRKAYVVQEGDIQNPYWRRRNHLLSVALVCRQS